MLLRQKHHFMGDDLEGIQLLLCIILKTSLQEKILEAEEFVGLLATFERFCIGGKV